MIKVRLPSGFEYAFAHAVFDYSGTLAEDGVLAEETKRLLETLAAKVKVTVLTADTFGLARTQLQHVKGVSLYIIEKGNEAAQKRDFILNCGKETTICFGNGANDRDMFREAALAVGVLGGEGAYQPTLAAADIVVLYPRQAIMLLLRPERLLAALRV